jgi:type III restriction enzyme
MDKGAHFHKCDFQVHTPRDIGWIGNDATSDADRKAYAEELILACRNKGLGAIAITDHHDFTFFPYVKSAARDELDEKGQPICDDSRIVVFPGIELTRTFQRTCFPASSRPSQLRKLLRPIQSTPKSFEYLSRL